MVLFVICVHNWDGYNGFRLNSLDHTAHPEEKEVLLADGVRMAVMGIEEILIDRSEGLDDDMWNKLNGKKLTVIYMFHAKEASQ